MAEHLDCSVEEIKQAGSARGSLIGIIEHLRRDEGRSLRRLRFSHRNRPIDLAGEEDVIDPEEPIDAKFLVRRAVPPKRGTAGHRRLYLFAGFILLLLLAVAILRMVPVAPYTVVNIVAGASHLRLGRFLLGTAIGMVPGIAALTWFSDSLYRSISDPGPRSLGVLVSATVFIGLGAWLLRRLLKSS